MRGLKHQYNQLYKYGEEVASFTDAWIETIRTFPVPFKKPVASFTDAWIETKRGLFKTESGAVASFTDAWIETLKWAMYRSR